MRYLHFFLRYLHLLQNNIPFWVWANKLTSLMLTQAFLLLTYFACSLVPWKVLSQRRDILTISKFVMYAYRKPNRKFCGPGSFQTSSKYIVHVDTAINLCC